MEPDAASLVLLFKSISRDSRRYERGQIRHLYAAAASAANPWAMPSLACALTGALP